MSHVIELCYQLAIQNKIDERAHVYRNIERNGAKYYRRYKHAYKEHMATIKRLDEDIRFLHGELIKHKKHQGAFLCSTN